MSNRKPILCLDFDGVIHSYTSGWKGATAIPDPPVDGAFAYIIDALNNGWDVVIHSSRGRYLLGPWAMRRWLREHGGSLYHDSPAGPGLERVRFSRMKPPAVFTIDDRAGMFNGHWAQFPIANLRAFKPWNKGGGYRSLEQRLEENKAAMEASRSQSDKPWRGPSRFA
jgi:hypothetical protein